VGAKKDVTVAAKIGSVARETGISLEERSASMRRED